MKAGGGLLEAHYKFTVSYDGTDYFGFQRQVNPKTIQGTLETALVRLGWRGNAIRGAGRTDTGVHAQAQVVSAALNWRQSRDQLIAAFNANLPADIAIQSAEQVRADFDPRRNAVSRTYRYTVFNATLRQPLRERFAWRLTNDFDADRLQAGAKMFLGTHDFAAFGSAPKKGGSTLRTVYQSNWHRDDSGNLIYEVEANGFLYRMVRRMVYGLVMTAIGQTPPHTIEDALETKTSFKPGLAPAAGLTLWKVAYPDWIYRQTENLYDMN